VARSLMEAGVDVLIEKPVAATLARLMSCCAWHRQHKRVAQVGHLERFNPAVRATLPLITRPMFFEVHRLSVFSPRALDVDVVLDLMIHDLDIVLAFVKSEVKEIRAVGLPILSGKSILRMCAWSLNRAAWRTLRPAGFRRSACASCDSFSRDNIFRSITGGRMCWCFRWEAALLVPTHSHKMRMNGAPKLGRPRLVNPQIAMAKPAITAEEPLLAEISAFLGAVRERSRPVVSLEDGRRAFGLGLAILAEIGRHAGRIGVGGFPSACARIAGYLALSSAVRS
jgi:predicted dehydrogenase